TSSATANPQHAPTASPGPPSKSWKAPPAADHTSSSTPSPSTPQTKTPQTPRRETSLPAKPHSPTAGTSSPGPTPTATSTAPTPNTQRTSSQPHEALPAPPCRTTHTQRMVHPQGPLSTTPL